MGRRQFLSIRKLMVDALQHVLWQHTNAHFIATGTLCLLNGYYGSSYDVFPIPETACPGVLYFLYFKDGETETP
jgi:hypothetical protein